MVNIVIRNMQCFFNFFVKEFCCAKAKLSPQKGHSIPILHENQLLTHQILPNALSSCVLAGL